MLNIPIFFFQLLIIFSFCKFYIIKDCIMYIPNIKIRTKASNVIMVSLKYKMISNSCCFTLQKSFITYKSIVSMCIAPLSILWHRYPIALI